MAPAQSLDIPQTPNSYTHKKFKGNRYAHKKFGTRTPSPPAPTHHHHLEHITQGELIVKDIKDLMVKEDITTNTTTPNNKNNKRSSGDIFRPYALDDDNTARRKRKLEELHRDAELEEEEEPQLNITKRFAPSPVMENVMSPQPLAIPHFNPALIPFIPPPNYRLQQYQFNAQTFALVLQKQQAALCMGQILKRQNNINLYNIMGN